MERILCNSKKFIFGLMLCASAFITVNNKTVICRFYENIVYVTKPVDPEFQQRNIYVPVVYFEDKSVGAYNAATAPIFLPNAQLAALADGLVMAAPAFIVDLKAAVRYLRFNDKVMPGDAENSRCANHQGNESHELHR